MYIFKTQGVCPKEIHFSLRDHVIDQIRMVGVGTFARGTLAYEPVWAIGTGQTATAEQAQAMHTVIRAEVATLDPQVAAAMRVLYGGSMNADNAETLLRERDIDGGLIGGASLRAESFAAIVAAAGLNAAAS